MPRRGGEIFDKKNVIESMGCQEGGGEKLIEKTSLKAWVAKKAKGGGKIIESIGCQEEGEAGQRIDKNKMLDNMGCQS